jgi:hypothetical protein
MTTEGSITNGQEIRNEINKKHVTRQLSSFFLFRAVNNVLPPVVYLENENPSEVALCAHLRTCLFMNKMTQSKSLSLFVVFALLVG